MIVSDFVIELIGTATLIFIGTLSRASYLENPSISAMSYFFLYFGLISAFGPSTGGLFNPILTLVLCIFKQIPTSRGIALVVAQLLGSFMAAFMAASIFYTIVENKNSNLPQPSIRQKHFYLAAVLEGIVAFLLAIVFGSIHLNKKTPKFVLGPAMAGVYYFGKLTFQTTTGGAFNFAEIFGPSIYNQVFDNWLAYLSSHLIGTIIGVTIYVLLLKDNRTINFEEELDDNNKLLEGVEKRIDDEPREVSELKSKK
jgi:glycerol uptake facilitator-like aquaporin